MRIYRPPMLQRIVNGLLVSMFLFLAAVVVIGIAMNTPILPCLATNLALSIPLIYGNLNLFPSLSISGQGLRVHRPLAGYHRVPWDAIVSVRPPRHFSGFIRMFGSQLLIVKTTNECLGLVHWIYALMYDSGGRAFFIHPGIDRRDDILSALRQHCSAAVKV